MKIREHLGISKKTQNIITRVLQLTLTGIFLLGIYYRSTGIIANAGVSLFVTFLPAVLERNYEVEMDPALVLWLTSAAFFHAYGVLGPYYNIGWWDHFTHALSASVVAGAAYATLRSIDSHYEEIFIPKKLFFVFILIFTVSFGVFWEILEFGIGLSAEITGSKPILAQHGIEDTMKDLIFDMIGGALTGIFGEIYLLGLVGELEEKLLK